MHHNLTTTAAYARIQDRMPTAERAALVRTVRSPRSKRWLRGRR